MILKQPTKDGPFNLLVISIKVLDKYILDKISIGNIEMVKILL